MNKQDTRNFFNSLAPTWDQNVIPNVDKIKTIIDLASINKGSSVLDLATGTGVLIPFIKDKKPGSISAIDISDEMIKQAKLKEDNRGVEFICGDFEEFSGKKFDRIICYQAYPHFEDKDAFIKKLYETLNPGGRFIIAHPDSKEIINNRHKGKQVRDISDILVSAKEESKKFKELFEIDVLVDNNDYFIISGIRK